MQQVPPDFSKAELLPAVVQDNQTQKVLMLGYMNLESWAETLKSGQVTFFSRSRQKLWVKGETSGNFLQLQSWAVDCDCDAILIKAHPVGPVCHTGADTCFNEANMPSSTLGFIEELEKIIYARQSNASQESSYVARLLASGVPKVAQKVGEEAVEVVIDACTGNLEGFKQESADLLFHFLVLLVKLNIPLAEVVGVLEERHKLSKRK